MYNISKVKKWIKKAAKTNLLYDPAAELVCDNCVMIRALPEMKPAILEVFGHLDGGWIPGHRNLPGDMAKMMELCTDVRTVADSTLMLQEDSVNLPGMLRILYDPQTGEKICVNQMYTELFSDFDLCQLLATSDGRKIFVVSLSGEVIGVIMPCRPSSEIMKQFEFTVTVRG